MKCVQVLRGSNAVPEPTIYGCFGVEALASHSVLQRTREIYECMCVGLLKSSNAVPEPAILDLTA